MHGAPRVWGGGLGGGPPARPPPMHILLILLFAPPGLPGPLSLGSAGKRYLSLRLEHPNGAREDAFPGLTLSQRPPLPPRPP